MTLRLISIVLCLAGAAAAQNITVGSLNLAMVTDAAAIVRDITRTPALNTADVLFFQEVAGEEGNSVAADVAARLGRNFIFASPDGRKTKGGLAILSRYPLAETRVYKLKQQNLVFRSRSRIALGATIRTDQGPVRLINTHLDTRINPGERIAQLQPALDDASCFAGPSVIGGDFNTNDMQWVSNVVPVPFPGWQASRVRILMESRGYSTPFRTRRATFDHMGMQLDWIFSNGLEARASGIEQIEFSDHHAIWATLVSPGSGSLRETARSTAARPGGA